MTSFKSGIKKARGSFVFLIGITLAFGTVFGLEQWTPRKNQVMVHSSPIDLVEASAIPLRVQRELNDKEIEMATVAWQYFDRNTNPTTGLVNSVDGYSAATLWDTASYLLALISAHDLGIVDTDSFDQRLTQALDTLAELKLFDGKLPNKVYSTEDASMTTYTNQATERGVGWSAIDLGRVMVPFHALVWQHPQYTPQIDKVLAAWDLQAIVQNAEMMGADIDEDGKTLYLQEGRLGYEEYAAKSLALAGFDLSEAVSYERHFEYVEIDGVNVGTDLRTPDKFDALNFVVSEPYVLDGIEFGWDRYSRALAFRLFEAQRARFERTKVVTAVSEDNIDQPPYFVYNTVFADGKAWNTVTEEGEDVADLRTLSTKAAIGWYALYDTPYSDKLFESINSNFDADKGWYAGIYEVTSEQNLALTANTNAIVLEALRYIQLGPMIKIGGGSS